MNIIVFAKPNSKHNKIEKIDDNNFLIRITAPPVKGLANKSISNMLADHFEVPKSDVKLVSGFSSKIKKFEILKGK